MPQLYKYWDRVRSSFWFLPSILIGGAIVFAFATLALDEKVSDRWLPDWEPE